MERWAQLLHDLAEAHTGITRHPEYVFEAVLEERIRRCIVRLARGSKWVLQDGSRCDCVWVSGCLGIWVGMYSAVSFAWLFSLG